VEPRLKLILSVEALSSNLTGIGRYTWELAQRLPHKVQLNDVRFYRNGSWIDNPRSLLNAAAPQSALTPNSPRPRFKLPRPVRDWGMRFACRGSVFHGPNFFLPACADKGVITVHDLSVFKFPETHPIERIKQFERDFARSVAQAAHVITDSKTTRAEVMAFTGLPDSRVTAVALGVSDVFKPVSDEDAAEPLQKYSLTPGAYALCVCTLEPRKKVAQLLAAWRLLPGRLRSMHPLVLIGGNGWLSQALQDEVSQAEAQGWVKRLGYVPEQDLPLLYAGAALFVYPSTYEGFGLPPVEAMACGVPVVVSDQSCLPEVTQGAALTVNPDDTEAFCAVLEKGLTDDAWRTSASAAGRAVAASYTWGRCVDQTVAVYQQMAI
jgi:glycosyltransferase involved in cell wall biosynthesis